MASLREKILKRLEKGSMTSAELTKAFGGSDKTAQCRFFAALGAAVKRGLVIKTKDPASKRGMIYSLPGPHETAPIPALAKRKRGRPKRVVEPTTIGFIVKGGQKVEDAWAAQAGLSEKDITYAVVFDQWWVKEGPFASMFAHKIVVPAEMLGYINQLRAEAQRTFMAGVWYADKAKHPGPTGPQG